MEQQLITALQGTLQPDAGTIRSAEHHLSSELHTQPAAGQALIKIVFAGETISLAIRQAAAVNLSNWIKQRWGPYFEEFKGFSGNEDAIALPVEFKQPIRESLLNALMIPESKLRGPMSKALVNVAASDWPDEFPELTARLKVMLSDHSGQNQDGIAGALAFLDDWVQREMDETGIVTVSRELLPDLERILGQIQTFPPSLRCHCISIFNQLLETLLMVRETYKDVFKAAVEELLPRWMSALEGLVASDPKALLDEQIFDRSAGEKYALLVQAWSTIRTCCHFRSHFKPRSDRLVQLALVTLQALQTPFQRYHISPLEDGEIDIANDSVFFSTPIDLARTIVDFIGVASFPNASGDQGRHCIIPRTIPLLRIYARVTREEELEWLENISNFVAAGEDEDLGGLDTSLRARCLDFVADNIGRHEEVTSQALQQAVADAHLEGQERKKRGEQDWWKEEEACLALIGGVSQDLVDLLEDTKVKGNSPPFDLEKAFAESVMPFITPDSPPFLYGRCFVFASQFASILPPHLAQSFLEAAVNVIEDESSSGSEGDLVVKLSAVRCLKNFHRHLPDSIVRPFSTRILSRLGPLLASAADDTLVLIVETLQAVAVQSEVAASDPTDSIPPQLYGEISAEAIKAWAKEAVDRMLQSAIEDLLEAFASQKSQIIAINVVTRTIPLLSHLLAQEVHQADDGNKYRSGVVVEGSLEFAGALARGARPEVLVHGGICEGFLPHFFALLDRSDDPEAFKNGASLLSSLIGKIPEQIFSWHDQAGHGASDHVLLLVSKMISTQDVTESGGLAVGDLLTTILRKAPEQLQSSLPTLCTALVDRLSTAASSSLSQSLIIPLAFLMKDHGPTVVQLLQNHAVQTEEGTQSGLVVLARKWVGNAETIQGHWNLKVSVIGLTRLLQANLSELDNVLIEGDMLPDDSNVIRTRSRAKSMPHKYTQIPLPAKIVKLLLHEYHTFEVNSKKLPRKGEGREEIDDDDDHDEDGDWSDDEPTPGFRKDEQYLSDMLGEDLEGGLEDLIAEHDEKVYQDDPIYKMDMKDYLSHFFTEEAQHSEASARFAGYLTKEEIELLKRAVTGR